jgi:hypothetical protein
MFKRNRCVVSAPQDKALSDAREVTQQFLIAEYISDEFQGTTAEHNRRQACSPGLPTRDGNPCAGQKIRAACSSDTLTLYKDAVDRQHPFRIARKHGSLAFK